MTLVEEDVSDAMDRALFRARQLANNLYYLLSAAKSLNDMYFAPNSLEGMPTSGPRPIMMPKPTSFKV